MKQVLALLFVLAIAGAGCGQEDDSDKAETPTGPSSTASSSSRLTISPNQASFGIGQKQCFTASGGDGRYRWVLDTGNGAPVPAGNGSRACYVSSFPVKFKMTVHSAGQEVTATGEVR